MDRESRGGPDWRQAIRAADWRAAASALDQLPEPERHEPGVRFAKALAEQRLGDCGRALSALRGLEAALPLLSEEIQSIERVCQLAVGPFDARGSALSRRVSVEDRLEVAGGWRRQGRLEELVHVVGPDADPYIHNYGTAGIIARLKIALEPLQDWRAFYASFDTFEQALSVIRPFADLEPTPRLVSADLPTLAEALPADPGIPAGRASLRAILDVESLDAATRLVEDAGGRVEDVREGAPASMKLSMISYNHPIEWLQKAYPGTYFHVEVSGDALVDRIDEVHAVYDGGMLRRPGSRPVRR